MKLFRRARWKEVVKGKTTRYLLYASGEIILVVLGILIALQVNNWNIAQKQREVELNILRGIRSDILLDTIDMNDNIRGYEGKISVTKQLLGHLTSRKEADTTVVAGLLRLYYSGYFIILNDAHFSQAKQVGLSIISNQALRQKISRLYEFDYRVLSGSEAEEDDLGIRSSVEEYLSLEEYRLNGDQATVKIKIDSMNYQQLLDDENLHIRIIALATSERSRLDRLYLPTRAKALAVAQDIEHELERLNE